MLLSQYLLAGNEKKLLKPSMRIAGVLAKI
jgi:hypothetical protein